MSKFEKPLTDGIKDKANRLFVYLKGKGDFATKEEIGEFLGVSNERSVRDVISLLATRKPIISHSGGKGYRLALTPDDLPEVERTWAELSSRAEELERRMQPLIAFREKCLRY